MSNSDITYNTSVFDPNQIPEDTKALNNYLINHAHESGPQFWEVHNPIPPVLLYALSTILLKPRPPNDPSSPSKNSEPSRTKAKPLGPPQPSASPTQPTSPSPPEIQIEK